MSLKVINLAYWYQKGAPIFENLNFSVSSGTVLGLIGPNGTGKSTLIRCLNRIIKPCGGWVYINDRDLSTLKRKEIGRYVSYVPQDTTSNFSISVADAVLLGRLPYNHFQASEEDKNIAFDMIEKLGLKALSFQNLNEISGGERQRVFLARALVQEPQVLLLDEPTSNLDIRYQLETLELVKEMAKKNSMAVVISIHDLNMAIRFSDEIMLMQRGTQPIYGDSYDVITQENIRNGYGVQARILMDDGKLFVNPIAVLNTGTGKILKEV